MLGGYVTASPVADHLDLRFPRERGGISYKPSVLRGRLAGVKMGLRRLVDAAVTAPASADTPHHPNPELRLQY
jgi:hypothetical protein